MSKKWLILVFSVLTVLCEPSFAAKPVREQAAAVAIPQAYSVKIDYTSGVIIVAGENLDPGTAAGTIAGVGLSLDGASSAETLLFPFSPAVAAAVDELGSYVLNISTDGGNLTLTLFIPIALVTPGTPLPPGPDCPCSTEWDAAKTTASPGGFAGLTPYCQQDTGDFVNVQFYDELVGNYWVLWTGWEDSSGYYCALYMDADQRSHIGQTGFDACAAYLRNIVTVWGDQGNDCIF
jgi:hypothetical protein